MGTAMAPRNPRASWFGATPVTAIYLLIGFAIGVVGAWIIGIFTFGPAENFVLDYFDRPILDFVRDRRVDLLTDLMKFFTWLGTDLILIIAGVALAVWAFLKTRDPLWPVFVAVTVLGAIFLDDIVKDLVERPRPRGGLVEGTRFTFPNGHSLNAAVMAGMFGYFLTNRRGRTETLWVWRGLGLAAFLIAFSRVYLSTDWPLDIIGGLCLGAFWVSVSLAAFRPR
ncbi:MAG: phosphatase PAP2 family protein [Actinobacteria bacterium]|nr:phosphatase PAP2 family protein [Actinomycetota bacterium]